MACLKFLATCPCPRCLVLKTKIPRIGTTQDFRDWANNMRVDNELLHHDIDLARKWLWKLLFELATWHALAKLRLHTESTLYDLENSTTRLGQILRKFDSVVCANYETKELPSEIAACGCRVAAARSKKAGKTAPATTLPIQPSTMAEPPNVNILENC